MVLLSDRSGIHRPVIMSLASRRTVAAQFIRNLPRTVASIPNPQISGISEGSIQKNHNQLKVVVATTLASFARHSHLESPMISHHFEEPIVSHKCFSARRPSGI